jgi:ATP-dependent helicase/nuclease subunit A
MSNANEPVEQAGSPLAGLSTGQSIAEQFKIVRAGAGAGKTYQLTQTVMQVAQEFRAKNGRWPHIIVTTFTRKATQELRERLMLRALDDQTGLIDFVNSRSHLMVSTIHGVLDLYLKRYGAGVCIDPNYSVISNLEAEKLARQALREVLFTHAHLQILLQDFDFAKLVRLVRNYADISSRHSGTKAHSIDSFEEIFAVFALELAQDLESIAADIRSESQVEDWLRMADEFLQLAKILKRSPWLEMHSHATQLVSNFKKARFNAKKPPVSEETDAKSKSVIERMRELLDETYSPQTWRQFADGFAKFEELGRLFTEEFAQSKIRQGTLEIGDLEVLAMKCLRSSAGTAEAFSQEWDYWLVDEYQDTSPFQVELLRHLMGDKPSFTVGDPQQSIYLFRGARSEVFANREKEVLAQGGTLDFLKKNYRSTPEFLYFLNDFFSRFRPPFAPMEANLMDSQPLDPTKNVASFFLVPPQETSEQENLVELNAVVAHIQGLLQKGARLEEICVLARTNKTLMDVAKHLGHFDLPTHVHAAGGFFERRETRDALALLKFLANPHDNFNLLELLRSPWFRVRDQDLVSVVQNLKAAADSSYWLAFLPLTAKPEMEAVARLQKWLELRTQSGILLSFREALFETGFIDLSHVQDLSGRRESNIWKLLDQLTKEEAQPGFNPLQFIQQSLAKLRGSTASDEGDAVAAVEPNRINLMTIHASKGLQFTHVILPRLHQKPRLTVSEEFTFDEERKLWAFRIPLGENRDWTASLAEKIWLQKFQKQELEESARVLYVALTRAVESVFMSWQQPAPKNSWRDMMNWDFDLGVHRGKQYSYEVLNEVIEPSANARGEVSKTQPRALYQLPVELEVSRSTSVSDILDVGQTRGTAPAIPISAWVQISTNGVLVHRLMEMLKYRPSRAQLENLIEKWFPDQGEKVWRAVNYVTSLSHPPLSEIIENGHVEWGFTLQESGWLMEGQIDLWGFDSQGRVWVIDYKTGSTEMHERAFQQMALYALALRKSGEVAEDQPIHLAAVYPFAKEFIVRTEPPPRQTVQHLAALFEQIYNR